MKVLLIGLGSIGTRHLKNILHTDHHTVSVVSRAGQLPAAFAHLTIYTSLPEALAADQFHAAVVCTPTAFHTAAVLALLEAQVPKIYIEKPVAHTLDGLKELIVLSGSYNNKIIVGYDLHFDPGLQRVKSLLDNNTIGKIMSVNAIVGQYLPDWRPHEDHRLGMSAKKETGGGVMLDLVHEFDYLLWLLGNVDTIACQNAYSNQLQIETEAVSDVLLRFQSGATGTIHLDYLQPQLVRNCLLTGEKGTIKWNLAASSVSWMNHHDRKLNEFSYAGFDRNERFVKIMEAFLSDGENEHLTSLEKGIESLQLVLAAKKSAETNTFIRPEVLH